MEQKYWDKADRGIKMSDYPEVNDAEVQFPEYIPVTYAVSVKDCGNAEFIVDGSTQICEYCGTTMFRTATRWYRVLNPEEQHEAEEWQKGQHNQGSWVEVR